MRKRREPLTYFARIKNLVESLSTNRLPICEIRALEENHVYYLQSRAR